MVLRLLHSWLYPGGRPTGLARAINWGWAGVHALGISPDWLVALDVVGRRSGRVIRFPLVMVTLDGERYLVSMFGASAAWVHNIRAAGGHAVLRHGRRERVLLVDAPPENRGRILRLYLLRAPAARSHIPVDMDAPMEELQAAAEQLPIFRLVPDQAA